MKENPANKIKDTMWHFLMDGSQKGNVQSLKEWVYDLIGMTTQKTAGQRREAKHDIPWEDFSLVQKELPYCICSSIGMALAKLKLIEDGEYGKDGAENEVD